jgi:Uma2 family endonuclease
VLVTRDPEDIEAYFKTRPTMVVEVTSPSTNVTDHREKALAYLKIEALRHYILIAQDEVKVEMYRRDRSDNWWLETLGPEHTIELETLNLEIPVKDLYEDVRL